MSAQILTQNTLKELLHYDPLTGLFKWKVRRSRIARKGDTAGSAKKKDGYRRVIICGKSYLAHRLAFLYVEGEFPGMHTDHINHIKDDNRFCNLRRVTQQENNKNRPYLGGNASGVMGVYWNNWHKKWQANIAYKGRLKHLGYFENKHKAIAVRKAAEVAFDYHPNHGVA